MLTPIDIEKKKFKKSLYGYSFKEVNDFMEQISKGVLELIEDAEQLRDQVSRYEFEIDKYKQIEVTLSETLVIAKSTAEDLINSAKKEADNTINDAKNSALEVRLNMEREIDDLRLKKGNLENEVLSFKARIKSILESQLTSIEQINVSRAE